ncbi:MAG TPA: helix-turn-helix transcriptional regulator [Chryseosolibacter sp.]|nr:helix-turn-helix transcriptional regulator [Chryseosolibacter sp.]
MTKLGTYLASRSVNKSEIARKTGLSNPRLSELTINPKAKLRADELYLIALAIGVDPCDLLKSIYSDIRLRGVHLATNK